MDERLMLGSIVGLRLADLDITIPDNLLRAKTSIVHASVVVRAIKPDILFLELDKKRARNIHKPPSEFAAAVDEAKRLGTTKIFCGDQDAQEEENLFQARQEFIIDARDKLMVDRLLKLSKDSSSIVAIVGRNHLPGMIRLWQKSNEN
ncbi:hypothetical protein QL285_085174 [Trifolium repens]|nr:hypothetical protein QL285_085174 [Trifolium repens]